MKIAMGFALAVMVFSILAIGFLILAEFSFWPGAAIAIVAVWPIPICAGLFLLAGSFE